jgi:hypothetical protein
MIIMAVGNKNQINIQIFRLNMNRENTGEGGLESLCDPTRIDLSDRDQ